MNNGNNRIKMNSGNNRIEMSNEVPAGTLTAG
jgi:hypothetical protein